MKLFFRTIFLFLLDIFCINLLFRLKNKNKVAVLWYHGISGDDFTLLKGYDERHIPKSLFKKQLTYLIRKGYTFVTMSELMNFFYKNQKIEKLVCITFDDGFMNVVNNAYPIMKEFHVKGIYYVVSDLINTNKLLWTDQIETVIRNNAEEELHVIFDGNPITYKLTTMKSREKSMKDIKRKLRSISNKERIQHMKQFENKEIKEIPKEFLFSKWAQLSALDKEILEIGCHTKTHPNCTKLITDEEMEEELLHSKLDIEEKIGYPIQHFCYPAGAFNEEIINKLKKYGYKTATTTSQGFNDRFTDPYKLNRIGGIEEDFLLFKSQISGSYYSIRNFIKKLTGI